MNPQTLPISEQQVHTLRLNQLKRFAKIGGWLLMVTNMILLVLFFIQSAVNQTNYVLNPQIFICFILLTAAFLLKFEEKNPIENIVIANIFCILSFVFSLLVLISFVSMSNNQSLIGSDLFKSSVSFLSGLTLLLYAFSIFTFSNSLFKVARIYHFLGLLAGILPLYGLLSIIYSMVLPNPIQTPIEMYTVINGLMLTIILLLSRPNHGVMRILTTPLHVSSLSRYLLIFAIITPIALELFRIFCLRLQLFNDQTSFIIISVLQILILTFFIWIVSNFLYNNDIELIRLSETLRTKSSELEHTTTQLQEKVKEVEASREKIHNLLHYQEKLQDFDN